MERCFPASDIFREPFFTKRQVGRIMNRIGAAAERVIGTDYMATATHRPAWFPLPPGEDFHDANRGISSKTVYLAYLFAHNPGIDQARAIRLATERAIPGPDGQLLYIPDMMSHAAPQRTSFYEIKPDSPSGSRAGEEKIASVDAFIHDLNLPYKPGTQWSPDRKIPLFRGVVFGLLVTVSFHYHRHPSIHGLIQYHFCVEADTVLLQVALALAILAVVLLGILFKLPLPSPGQPVPVPGAAPGSGGAPGTLSGKFIPLDKTTGLVFVALDQTPQTAQGVLTEIRPFAPTATLASVTKSLAELEQLGAARQVGDGFVKVPGFVPVKKPEPPVKN